MDVLSFLRDLPPSGKILLVLCTVMALLAAAWCVASLSHDDKDDSDDDFWSI